MYFSELYVHDPSILAYEPANRLTDCEAASRLPILFLSPITNMLARFGGAAASQSPVGRPTGRNPHFV